MACDWMEPAVKLLSPWLRWLFRYSLFVALVQLLVGGIVAAGLTERWQRWRQRREFQYNTMSKLSESSMELFVLLGELLSIHPLRQGMADVWDDRQRRYISERLAFHALEADIRASYSQGDILARYYELKSRAKALFDIAQATGQINQATYQPIQEEFLAERKTILATMIAEMKLLSWRERRALRQKAS